MVYTGPPSKCLQYLARVGYTPPADYNPADFVMDLVNSTDAGASQLCSAGNLGAPTVPAHADDGGTVKTVVTVTPEQTLGAENSTRTVRCDEEQDTEAGATQTLIDKKPMKSIRTILIESWDNTPLEKEIDSICAGFDQAADTFDDSDDVAPVKYLASYKTQFVILLERALINSRAQFTSLTIFQALAVALITGALWFHTPNKESRISDKASYIFFFMTYWFFSTLFHVRRPYAPNTLPINNVFFHFRGLCNFYRSAPSF